MTRTVLFTLGVAAAAAMLLASPSTGDAKTLADEALPAAAQSEHGGVALEVSLDRTAVLQASDGVVHAEVVLSSTAVPELSADVPTDLVVVLDRSGSMAGEKLEHARRATQELIDLLGPEDRFGLVSYDNRARVEIELQTASAARKQGWARTVRGLTDGGNTNLSGGLDLGLAEHASERLGRAARTVLISDGLANEGDTSADGLARRARAAGVAEAPLSTVGVGADFDEELMARLADAGTGAFYFLERGSSMGAVFAAELRGSRDTVVSGLTVGLDLPEGVRLIDAGGYPVERDSFRVGSLFAGQERRIWLTLAVPTATTGRREIGGVTVSWSGLDGVDAEQVVGGLEVTCVEDPDRALASVDSDAWGRVVVHEQYQALKSSVASDVKRGDMAEAKRKIARYKEDVSADNAVIGSSAVSANLLEVDTLEAEVDDAFEGPDASMKQVWAAKSMGSSSFAARRGQVVVEDE